MSGNNKFSIVIVVPVISELGSGSNLIFYFYSLYERIRFRQYLVKNFKDLTIEDYTLSLDELSYDEVVSLRRKGRVKFYENYYMLSSELEQIHCNSNYILNISIPDDLKNNFYDKFFDWIIDYSYQCCYINPNISAKYKFGLPNITDFYG